MKKIAKWILPLVLVAVLIASTLWYMFEYDRETVQEILVNHARNCAQEGNFDGATWFYDLSYQLSEQDQDVAIELAEIYASVGNYTKAEYTLTNAIANGASTELYIALCKTFVEQDKLLDAVTMLDNIGDPALKAELDALRPTAPQPDSPAGFYTQYITLNFLHSGTTLYVTTDGEYPSTDRNPSVEPLALGLGETKVYALSLGENGLVSPLSIFNYTVGGVVEPVTLTDASVETLVREFLMYGSETTIYTSDLWNITDFTVPAEAQTLDDLALMTHLKKLSISGREIPTLNFLSGMTTLEELVITDCDINCDTSIIGTLPSLKKLTIANCGLSTVAELAGARTLQSLDLSNNAIGNLSPLSGMTSLERLSLSENAVTDLEALSALSQLKELDLSGNTVRSIAPLATCVNLKALDISYNAVSEIGAVGNLTELVSFSAAHNSISDLSALSSCKKLEKLDVSSNVLTELTVITELSSLINLDFSYNAVSVIPALPKSSPLVSVAGNHNVLTDISALSQAASLNYAYFDYNAELKDIKALEKCNHLVQVNLYATAVPTDSVNALIASSVIVNFDPT